MEDKKIEHPIECVMGSFAQYRKTEENQVPLGMFLKNVVRSRLSSVCYEWCLIRLVFVESVN